MTRTTADVLARLLDGEDVRDPGSGTRRLAALAWLLHGAAARPDPAFRDRLRRRLLAVAATADPAPAPTPARWRGAVAGVLAGVGRSLRTATVGLAAAVAVSAAGVGVAAERSVPGDILYPVKTALRDVRLALAAPGADTGIGLLDRAGARLQDAATAVGRGNQDAAAAALQDADEDVREGARWLLDAYRAEGQQHLLGTLGRRTATLSRTLGLLSPRLRGPAATEARSLATSLERVRQRTTALRVGACPCARVTPAAAPGGAAAAPDGPVPWWTGPAADLTRIPPATEPFAACPCVPGDGHAAPAPHPRPRPSTAVATPGVDSPPGVQAPPAVHSPPRSPTAPGSGPGDPDGSVTLPGSAPPEGTAPTGPLRSGLEGLLEGLPLTTEPPLDR